MQLLSEFTRRLVVSFNSLFEMRVPVASAAGPLAGWAFNSLFEMPKMPPAAS